MSTAGYSGKPLGGKLGFMASSRVLALDAPADYARWLAPLPEGLVFEEKAGVQTDFAHVFCTERAALARHLAALRKALRPDAAIWVSWPKKAAKVPTDITEDVIREIALPMGLVDIKVCAVSEVWSGLKLVLRKELRS